MNNNELQTLAHLISANITICQKSVLSAPEAAAYLNISKSYLYKLTMARKIPFSRPLGKMMYFDRVQLERWLLSNRISTSDEIRTQAETYCATRTRGKKGGQK